MRGFLEDDTRQASFEALWEIKSVSFKCLQYSAMMNNLQLLIRSKLIKLCLACQIGNNSLNIEL